MLPPSGAIAARAPDSLTTPTLAAVVVLDRHRRRFDLVARRERQRRGGRRGGRGATGCGRTARPGSARTGRRRTCHRRHRPRWLPTRSRPRPASPSRPVSNVNVRLARGSKSLSACAYRQERGPRPREISSASERDQQLGRAVERHVLGPEAEALRRPRRRTRERKRPRPGTGSGSPRGFRRGAALTIRTLLRGVAPRVLERDPHAATSQLSRNASPSPVVNWSAIAREAEVRDRTRARRAQTCSCARGQL